MLTAVECTCALPVAFGQASQVVSPLRETLFCFLHPHGLSHLLRDSML